MDLFPENGSFNPRPHAEGDKFIHLLTYCQSGFNPRPHAEGDTRPTVPAEQLKVSIHALTRRATPLIVFSADEFSVSIHALTRRATKIVSMISKYKRFQSTPSRGGRPYLRIKQSKSVFCFNPRPHAEGDDFFNIDFNVVNSFNPRPHAEGDSRVFQHLLSHPCFNPRPHAEGDLRKN